ncbi:MAG: 15-cis-phytoene synthase [Solirubrobacteraceae bacterium]|nr:15-cis-phytoene synthase [Solirubrobacteraceae bacterium]
MAGAYAHCESLTRAQAANFYYGIRLLTRTKRRAMCAVYSFARRVDDIGDGALEQAEKLRLLEAEALVLGALESRAQSAPDGDPVAVALRDAYERFELPAGALGELIEGVRMDIEGTSYETFEELVLYCRRVAGSIGRVSLAIFGLRAGAGADMPAAQALADDLGVALQLTNILRDIGEDAENGRVYLPGEDLRRFGLVRGEERRSSSEMLAALAQRSGGVHARGGELERREQLASLMGFEAQRAREWFARGMALAPLLDRRSAACVLAMAGIYRRLLERIAAHPQEAMRRRMSLPVREKAWVAARGMLGGAAG